MNYVNSVLSLLKMQNLFEFKNNQTLKKETI